MSNTVENQFLQIDSRLKSIEAFMSEIASKEQLHNRLEKRYYSIEETAKAFDVSPITIYRHTKSGQIPCKKIGGRTMVPISFIER